MDRHDMEASENNPKAERELRERAMELIKFQSLSFCDWSVRYRAMTKITFSEPQVSQDKIREVPCGSPLGTKCSSNGGDAQ